MNVFEDLVTELQQENLLELTVIDVENSPRNGNYMAEYSPAHDDEPLLIIPEPPKRNAPLPATNQKPDFGMAEPIKARNEIERFRKQSVDEIAALQMVEHVLSGVERDYSKIEPNVYDDLPAKKALHRYLQAAEDVTSDEYFDAESAFLREIDAWRHALAKRDVDISVCNLRHYSETTQPALSSQALFALVRFYRNADYSEQVRSKFDFSVTRLFSRNMGDFTRQMLFDRAETVGHLKKRYNDWAGSEYFSLSDDDPDVLLSVLSFEDFIIEAANVESFDELLKSDFLPRLGVFKRGIGSAFFSPIVAAAAIECNVRIGNKYIELLSGERTRLDEDRIRERYENFDDRGISDFLGRTLEFDDLLQQEAVIESEAAEDEAEHPLHKTEKVERPVRQPRIATKEKFFDFTSLGVNKWLLATTIVVVIACVGLYVWVEYFSGESVSSASVKSVNFDASSFKEYIKTATISGETLYGVTTPIWDKLSQEKREELLLKMYQFGGDNGYKKIHLTNGQGKSVGYASELRLEVYNP